MSVSKLHSVADHDALIASSLSSQSLVVLLFVADWHPPCKQMSAVCQQLAKQQHTVKFAEIDAEGLSDVTEQYPVASVPTSVLVRDGKVVASLEGANAVDLTNLVNKHSRAPAVAAPTPAAAAAATPAVEETPEQLNARLAQLVSASPVMAFIKGSPEAPRCGFTKQLLALLKEHHIQYGSFDILTDQVVREGLKKFSNWPTYPQLYIQGELVGGLDVVKELAASGELEEMVPAAHIQKPASTPAAAAAPKAAESEEELVARIKSLISSQRVMLFMKGDPSNPQCGFSRQAVALLAECGLEVGSYGHFNIFSDEAVREGIKKVSNWPTFPQLYVEGELIGGLDVMKEMHEGGELKDTLKQ